jgi:L-amino acid N-acyltransferase YncA
LSVHIRPVRVDDASAIREILNAIIAAGSHTVLDTPFSMEEERAYIKGFPRRGVFNVAVEDPGGRLVGLQSIKPFATYSQAFSHVGSVGTFVDLSARRRGIGLMLSKATFDEARCLGYEKVFTYVRADNLASLAFHLKLGFRVVGIAERQAKLRGQYVDEIVIEKFL